MAVAALKKVMAKMESVEASKSLIGVIDDFTRPRADRFADISLILSPRESNRQEINDDASHIRHAQARESVKKFAPCIFRRFSQNKVDENCNRKRQENYYPPVHGESAEHRLEHSRQLLAYGKHNNLTLRSLSCGAP